MIDIAVVEGSHQHLDAIVRIHLEALPADDNIVSAMGPGAVRAAHQWFLKDAGAVVLVATSEGRSIGFTSIADRPYLRTLLMRMLPRVLATLVLRPRLFREPVVRDRMARLRRRGRPEVPDGAYVAYIAVAAEARSRGVGAVLTAASIEWCRDRRIERLIAGVHRDNLASRRMHERAGFAEVPEYRDGDMLIYVLPIAGSTGQVDD